MKIKKSIETSTGTFLIDCEFNAEEVDAMLEIGLNVLLATGSLPFQTTDEEGVYNVVPPSELIN